MRVLVWTAMLLLLTVVGSMAGLVRMIGMPIGAEVLAPILMLAGAVCAWGIVLVVVPQPGVVPVRVL